MAGFADSIKINSTKILAEIQAKCYTITDDLFTTVVYNTPVLKGELINNWFTSTGDILSSATTTTLDTAGNDSLLNIESLSQEDLFNGKDDIASLTNNIDYSYNAEFIGWPLPEWSGRVGPYAMVRNSLTQIAAKYE